MKRAFKMTFFYFNIPFQVAIGKLRLSWGGGNNLVGKKVPHNGKI